MKKPTQREQNPYKYSDSNKRYQTFDYYLRRRFGGKCAKISLDAGFSCPNLDGTVGCGGCIYCSGGSSGAQSEGDLRHQYDSGTQVMKRKWKTDKFIPYLQAHTNTYAPIETLRKVYETAAGFPGAVMLAIATRADCLDDEVVELLCETSEKIPVLLELGLQTSNDETAKKIGRGHSFDDFCRGYERVRCAGGDIALCVHIINGLPGETHKDMIKTAIDCAALKPDMVKIHSLHILKNTPLEQMYESGLYVPMEQKDYVSVTATQIEYMPPETVIARLTGDGMESLLTAPLWCRRKTAVINDIDKELFARKSYQGMNSMCIYS